MASITKRTKPRKGCLQFRTKSWRAVITTEQDGEVVRKWINLNTDSKAVARRKLARMLKEPEVAGVQAAAVAPETYAELAKRVRLLRRDQGLKDCDSEESIETLWIDPRSVPCP